jgi:hypothetical protein
MYFFGGRIRHWAATAKKGSRAATEEKESQQKKGVRREVLS